MAIICPNKNTQDWKDLLKKVGKDKAYLEWHRKYSPEQKEVSSDDIQRSKELTENLSEEEIEKINRIKKGFPINVNVEIDDTIEGSGKSIIKKGKTPTIKLNPNELRRDTISHEFAHIFVDIVEGENSNFIKSGMNKLKDTELWNEVLKDRPDLETEEEIGKEALVTAVGRKGEKIFEEEKNKSEFKKWIDILLNKIKRLLGINKDVSQELASRMVSRELTEVNKGGMDPFHEDKEYYQKKEDEVSKKMNKLLNELDSNTVTKLKNLSKKGHTKDKGFMVRLEKTREVIKEALESKKDIEDIEALNDYLNRAKKEISLIEKRINKKAKEDVNKLSYSDLYTIYNYVSSYDILDDVKKSMNNMSKQLSRKKELSEYDKELKKILDRELNREGMKGNDLSISDIISKKEEVVNTYEDLGKEKLADEFAPEFKYVEKEWEEDLKAQYMREEANEGEKNDMEKNEELYKYVTKKMEENNEEIKRETKDRLIKSMNFGMKEVNSLTSNVADPRSFNDEMIKMTVDALGFANSKARRTAMNVIGNSEELYKEYEDKRKKEEGSSLNKMADFWSPILEFDENGNPTGYIIGKYHSDFKNKALKEFREKQEKYFQNKLDTERSLNELFDENEDVRSEYNKNYSKFVKREKPKYLNKKWEEIRKRDKKDPVLKMYNKIRNTFEASDNKTKKSGEGKLRQMMTRHPEEDTYRFPIMRKTGLENMLERNPAIALKEGAKEMFFREADETDFGQLYDNGGEKINNADYIAQSTNEMGETQHSIPIHFRRELKEGIKGQSLDLMSVAMMDAYNTSRYSEMKTIEPKVETIQYIAGERKVADKRGGKTKVNINTIMDGLGKLTGIKESDINWKKGKDSNIYQAIKSNIENNLYNIKLKDEPGADVAKGVAQMTTMINLGLNVFAGTVAATHGSIMNWMMAQGGGILNKKNLTKGMKEYVKYKKEDVWDDTGKRIKMSKNNQVMNFFDIKGDWLALPIEYSANNRVKSTVNTDSMFLPMNSAEHYVATSLSYGIMDTIKILDKEGNETGETLLEITKSGEKGVPILEKNGKKLKGVPIKINGKTEYFSYELSQNRGAYEVEKLIQQASKKAHGNYRGDNKAKLQRHWYGLLGFIHRKWAVPGTQERWKGFMWKNINKPWRELSEDQKFFDELTGEIEEGNYTTSARYMVSLYRNLKQAKYNLAKIGGKKEWNKLSDWERSNIKKATTELSIAALSIFAAKLIAEGLGEDDDEERSKWDYYGGYVFRRTYMELVVYSPLGAQDAMTLVSDPYPSQRMISNALELTSYAAPWNWEELNDRYERDAGGFEKGDLKIYGDIVDMTPLDNAPPLKDIESTYNFLKRGGF